jgi:hypothetical protein
MERFPRGTLPPSAFRAIARERVKPATATTQEVTVQRTEAACDLTVTCPTCMIEMQPEHAHYKCPSCGYRDSCCF